ncbi:MAG: hypothetical protein A2X12_11125 [Bacteroidetes bacterium GWE2_29_8]|nr:MAG: hypothetical protein A2X12_11125 [Bacteroidetes bacterium GWE2_29_8]OFY22332.1 MAG: hypothetical protein A2X02_07605 [Bacteroidetes bacterium GWF2_29_10]
MISNAQIKKGNPTQLKNFNNSTTYFVKDDRYPMYNEAIIKYAQDFWKITPFKIVYRNDIDTLILSKTNSFIIPSEVTIVLEGKKQNYIYINTLLGGKPKLNGLPDIGSFPLADIEDDEESYNFKVPLFLQLIQYHIATSINNPEIDYFELIKLYNKNKKKLEQMELWLLETDLDEEINSIDKVKKTYSNNVKVVTKEEMAKAIIEKKQGIAVVHNVYPKNYSDGNECWKMIISTSDGEILYLLNRTINKSNNPKINNKDLKRFN